MTHRSEAKQREALRGIDYSGVVAGVDATQAARMLDGPDGAASLLALQELPELREKNQNWSAVEVSTRAVLLAEDSPIAWAELGRSLLTKGLASEGRAAYAAAVQLAPQDPELLMGVADATIRVGDRAAAIDALQRVLAVAPDHAQARERLALQLYYAGRAPEAWLEVHVLEAAGGSVPPQFRVLLSKAMAEPR